MVGRGTIVIFILVFSILGILLGFAETLQSDTVIHALTLETDKPEYRVGDKVTFTATNTGDSSLLFNYGSLQLNLENLDTHRKYHVISGQVFNRLEPGQSKTIVWNENRDGKLEPGYFVAKIQTSAASGNIIRVQTYFSVLP